jgi:Ca2+-transporting ATPase
MVDKYQIWEKGLIETSSEVVEGKGRNVIPMPKKRSVWLRYLDKFKDPLIIILLVILGLSCAVTGYEYYLEPDPQLFFEPLGVVLAILLSTGIGFIFENKAEKEFDVLNQVKDDRPVKVIRKASAASEPRLVTVKRADVVPGDIVRLEPGDEIPADGRVLMSEELRVDESAFTGEPYVMKYADKSRAGEDMAYDVDFLLRGSIVLEGFCLYEVTAVGLDTEEGKGALRMRETEEVQTPLNKQLGDLGDAITKVSYVLAILIVIGRLLYYFIAGAGAAGGIEWLHFLEYLLDSVMIAVTLIVVAVPEGLPMSVTISLALSMRKMLREKNLVRKLHACETMGATTVICTDKTGTLTMNQMTVLAKEFSCDDDIIIANVAVNSTADLTVLEDGTTQSIGNPTECALLRWIRDEYSADYKDIRVAYDILSTVPFSTQTKYMEVVARNRKTGNQVRLVKGAPEYVMRMCADTMAETDVANVQDVLSGYQGRALRTLAFAYQRIDEDDALQFGGIVGIADPVRPGVKEAIETCRVRAGVRVIVVTGDVAATAEQIGMEIGLFDDGEKPFSMSGQEFAAMSDEQAKEAIKTLRILSRARPEDKSRLVGLLQENGEVVAVTGDGTNDALALKKAQVGLSMGDGTARAKEVSDITILDNSFVSINKAILWGRSLYLNIRRFILFQMTINVCACILVLVGAFLGVDSPLTVTQMLWVNLIMDTFAAMALSSLPADPKVFDDKPRDPKSHIIDRKMIKRILLGGLTFFGLLIFLWEVMLHCDITSVGQLFQASTISSAFAGSGAGAGMTPYEMGVFFTTFVMLQFWNMFNAKTFRSGGTFFGHIFSKTSFSASFYLIALVILVTQILIVNYLGNFFDVAPLSFTDWIIIIAATSPVLLLPELVRALRKG